MRTRSAHSLRRRLFRPSVNHLENRLAPALIAWDGGPTGTGTEWTVAANWAGDKLPTSSDEANIGAAFSGIAITHSTGTSTIQKITSEAAVTITGGTLILTNGNSTVNKLLTIGAGAPGGTLDIRSVALNGPIEVQGTIRITGSVSLGGPLTTVAGS